MRRFSFLRARLGPLRGLRLAASTPLVDSLLAAKPLVARIGLA
jgi:hypothetical protein